MVPSVRRQLEDWVSELQVLSEECVWTQVNFMPYFYVLMLN